jgi:capsular polysaccharide biosynthesis protein
VIEIIEKASVPLYKSSPKTKKNVIMAGFVSLFMFIGLAFVLEYISKMNPDKEEYREFNKHLKDIRKDLTFFMRIFRKRK